MAEAHGDTSPGTQERLCSAAWPARILNAGSSDQSHPGQQQPYAPRPRVCFDAPETGLLTERGFVRSCYVLDDRPPVSGTSATPIK